jgi:fucose 4-O-acetylase-like acetyltransferase
MNKERNYYLDNAKFFLIFLVVLGHVIEQHTARDISLKALYLTIYSFHMPMFVFISGMLSTKICSAEIFKKNIASLIVPLIIFQALYEILDFSQTGHFSNYTKNFQPYWILWYLFSLFFWRIGLFIFDNLRFSFLLSIFIALIAGYIPETGYYLGISRTLTFFPIFFLGNILTQNFLSRLDFKLNKFLFSIVLISAFLFFYFYNIDSRWLMGSLSYKSLGHNELYACFYRIINYLASIIIGFSFIGILPRKNILYSFGQNSMFVFLWHVFIIKVLNHFGILGLIWAKLGIFSIGVYVFLACLLTICFSFNVIAKFTNKYFLEPARKIILKTN